MKYTKALWTLLFCTIGLLGSKAQDIDKEEVPVAVRTAFAKQYPNASDADWKKRGEKYRVSFDNGKIDYKATYSALGKTISYQKDVPVSSLPKAIAASIKAKYPKATIDDVDWVNTAGKISYEIGLDGTPDATLWYAADGTFIKEEAD